MSIYKRGLESVIKKAIEKKMVFLGGPRQVGKTTLALDLLKSFEKQKYSSKKRLQTVNEKHPAYLNWDHPHIASQIRKGQLPPNESFIIIDEIHKYARWRNLVKGIYDTEKSYRKILITGSARLDYYRKGGDSLMGRYRYFRLHPFSLMELTKNPDQQTLEDLLKYSGFPEPLFQQNEREWRIWQKDRISHVVKEDLRDLESVKEISLIEHLVELLPNRVGSLLSIKSLKEDLSVDHKTVERWLYILENLYFCFRVSPYGSNKIRAVKKKQKIYLWDWSLIPEQGPRFENLVASQLLKYCHFLEDTEGYTMELRYLRDTSGREVDFVVLQDKKPLFAVECKSGKKSISKAIEYFKERTNIPYWYQVHKGKVAFSKGPITVLPFIQFCKEQQMP